MGLIIWAIWAGLAHFAKISVHQLQVLNLKSLWLHDNRDLPANRAKYFVSNHGRQESLAN